MPYKVYIDGQAGTTGLQLQEKLSHHDGVELLLIAEEKRKDEAERKRLMNLADVVFLCLPDAAAKEAVHLVENPNTCIIDASTAHRTAEGWTYGFPGTFSGTQRSHYQVQTHCQPRLSRHRVHCGGISTGASGHRCSRLSLHRSQPDRIQRRRQIHDCRIRSRRTLLPVRQPQTVRSFSDA